MRPSSLQKSTAALKSHNRNLNVCIWIWMVLLILIIGADILKSERWIFPIAILTPVLLMSIVNLPMDRFMDSALMMAADPKSHFEQIPDHRRHLRRLCLFSLAAYVFTLFLQYIMVFDLSMIRYLLIAFLTTLIYALLAQLAAKIRTVLFHIEHTARLQQASA